MQHSLPHLVIIIFLILYIHLHGKFLFHSLQKKVMEHVLSLVISTILTPQDSLKAAFIPLEHKTRLSSSSYPSLTEITTTIKRMESRCCITCAPRLSCTATVCSCSHNPACLPPTVNNLMHFNDPTCQHPIRPSVCLSNGVVELHADSYSFHNLKSSPQLSFFLHALKCKLLHFFPSPPPSPLKVTL